MKQKHKAIADLVKLTFLSAEIQADFQAFCDGLVKGRSARGLVSSPESGNPYSSGMPVEMRGLANGGLFERFFEKAVESGAGRCHPTSFGIGAQDGNRLRDFLINLSRRETRVDGSGSRPAGSVPLRLLALCS